jgi:hypothetical protein
MDCYLPQSARSRKCLILLSRENGFSRGFSDTRCASFAGARLYRRIVTSLATDLEVSPTAAMCEAGRRAPRQTTRRADAAATRDLRVTCRRSVPIAWCDNRTRSLVPPHRRIRTWPWPRGANWLGPANSATPSNCYCNRRDGRSSSPLLEALPWPGHPNTAHGLPVDLPFPCPSLIDAPKTRGQKLSKREYRCGVHVPPVCRPGLYCPPALRGAVPPPRGRG